MSTKLIGSAILAVPALLLAWALLWKRQRQVFWLAAALIVVGTGYLAATGAADDVARRIAPSLIAATPPAPAR